MGLAAPICDDFDSVLQCRWHDRFHALQQHRRVPLARILRTIECLSGNGTFGQALHGEIIEFAAFDDLHAWRDAVVGKSRAIAGSVLVTCLGSSADIPAMTPCADTSTLALARQPWIEPITGQ
jgi:hypothetical protein